MKIIIAILAASLSTTALAKDVIVHFSEDEIRVQANMNEIALKAAGDAAADAYVVLRAKYRAAIQSSGEWKAPAEAEKK
jgi:hypothetical protein